MTDTKRIGDYAAHTQLMEILECTPDVHEGYTTADGTHIGEEIIPDNSETEYRAAVIAGTKEFPIAYIDAKECFKLFKNRPLEINQCFERYPAPNKSHRDDQWYAVPEKPIGDAAEKSSLAVSVALAEWLLPNYAAVDEASTQVCFVKKPSGGTVLVTTGKIISDGYLDRAFAPELMPLESPAAEKLIASAKDPPAELLIADVASHAEWVPLTDSKGVPFLLAEGEALAIMVAMAHDQFGNVDGAREKFRPLAAAQPLAGRPGGLPINWNMRAARADGSGALRFWYVNARAMTPEQWNKITGAMSQLFNEKNTNVARLALLTAGLNRVANLAGTLNSSTVDGAVNLTFRESASRANFLDDVLHCEKLVQIAAHEIAVSDHVSDAAATPKVKEFFKAKLAQDEGAGMLQFVADHLEALLPRVEPTKPGEHMDPNYPASSSVPRRLIAYLLLMGRNALLATVGDTSPQPVFRLMGVAGAKKFILQVHKQANLFDLLIDHFKLVADNAIDSADDRSGLQNKIYQMWQPLADAKRVVMDEVRDAKAKADQDARDATMKVDQDTRDHDAKWEGRYMQIAFVALLWLSQKLTDWMGAYVNPVSKYSIDLRAKAARGEIPQPDIVSYLKPFEEFCDILLGRGNPLLLGVQGVGKTVMFNGLALVLEKVANKDFAWLSGVDDVTARRVLNKIYELVKMRITPREVKMHELAGAGGWLGKLEMVVGGLMERIYAIEKRSAKRNWFARLPLVWRLGEIKWVNKIAWLKKFFAPVREGKKIVPLFDESHQLYKAGSSEKTGDARALQGMKPSLADGRVSAGFATTHSEHNKNKDIDPPFTDRLTPVRLYNPGKLTQYASGMAQPAPLDAATKARLRVRIIFHSIAVVRKFIWVRRRSWNAPKILVVRHAVWVR